MYQLLIAFIFSFAFLLQTHAQQTLPKVVSGRIERVENFQSKYVTVRTIDVWLPQGYSDSAKYAVLYMHDGQMLFDPEQAWNKQAWDVDDAATALFAASKVRKFTFSGAGLPTCCQPLLIFKQNVVKIKLALKHRSGHLGGYLS